MLTNITIQNIVLIDKLDVAFGNGLCVLSGETGSGKSIVLDSLGLAIGNRASSRLLRKGSKQGVVVAQFDIINNNICQNILQENGLEDQESKNIVTLKRILFDNLTSKAFINDIPVSLNLLNQVGDSLLEIHGQNEQRGLLNSSFHRQILDQFAGNDELSKLVSQKYQNWREVEDKLEELRSQKDKNDREIDYLSHIIKELESADIQPGEEDILVEKKNLLKNKEKINNLVLEVGKDINDADTNISSAQNNLIRNQNLSEDLSEGLDFSKIVDLMDEIVTKNDQVRDFIDQISNSLDDQEETLEEIEERLFLIKNLSRKFNKTFDELPEFLEKSKEELDVIINYQEISGNLEEKRKILKEEYVIEATKLSNSRKEAAIKLSAKVEEELLYLKMGNVKFLSEVTDLEEQNYGRGGINNIRFLAAINQNSDFDQIAKIASGGELSRFMLALKVALLDVKSVPILIFDEIDSGIGGAVANAVGERLKLLADNLQIIVVTHHAQVAAKSNYHLRVRKEDFADKTNTILEVLDESEKQREIARMLSGEDISEEASAAARKLMVG